MKDVSFLELVLVAFVVMILVSLFFGGAKNRDEFKKVCDEAHGTAVYDGRQYQCIRP